MQRSIMPPLLKRTSSGLVSMLHLDSLLFQFSIKDQTGCGKQIFFEPRQRAHSSPLAAGLASKLKIDFFILTVLRSTAVTGRTFPAACRGEGSIDPERKYNGHARLPGRHGYGIYLKITSRCARYPARKMARGIAQVPFLLTDKFVRQLTITFS